MPARDIHARRFGRHRNGEGPARVRRSASEHRPACIEHEDASAGDRRAGAITNASYNQIRQIASVCKSAGSETQSEREQDPFQQRLMLLVYRGAEMTRLGIRLAFAIALTLLGLGGASFARASVASLDDLIAGQSVPSGPPALLGMINELGRNGWQCAPERAATSSRVYDAELPRSTDR